MDKCSTLAEAVKFLSSAKLSTGNNYLMVDETGDMAVVEASPEKVRVRKTQQNFLVATNHLTHPEMVDMENVKERPMTMRRYKRIPETISTNAGKVDIEVAKKILSDHRGNVCLHVKAIKLGTLWSLIALAVSKEVLVAPGHPCKASYREDKRLKGLLVKKRLK